MNQFARAIGFLALASGILLLGFPKATKRIMQARAEYAHLSSGALRLLGSWELLTGAMLVAVTASPALEAKISEVVSPEHRKAA
ncbi:MAG: hypothetical protein ACUVX1_03615 [Chloroflexota bacterium]